ncbi:MAG TPA: hypothetical protein VFI00_13805 [Kribbella sp.]|nr:hypothetical protein [Kribbella sp.]
MPTLTAEELLAGSALTHRVTLPAHLVPHSTGTTEAAPAEVVVRPLVLADIARLNRAAADDGDLASALMVHQALVEPRLTLEQVHRLPAGLVEFVLGEVNRVSGLSLHGDELEDAVHAPLARACFVLAREFGWTPDRCAELTVGQVLLYLEMLGRGEHPAS